MNKKTYIRKCCKGYMNLSVVKYLQEIFDDWTSQGRLPIWGQNSDHSDQISITPEL